MRKLEELMRIIEASNSSWTNKIEASDSIVQSYSDRAVTDLIGLLVSVQGCKGIGALRNCKS